MATDRERMEADAKAHGIDPRAITDTSTGDRAQRSYIALKLFQIEEHMRLIAENAVIDPDNEGIG